MEQQPENSQSVELGDIALQTEVDPVEEETPETPASDSSNPQPSEENKFDLSKAWTVGHAIDQKLETPDNSSTVFLAEDINRATEDNKNALAALDSMNETPHNERFGHESQLQEAIKRGHESIQGNLNLITGDLAELYDLNPERFANLPTSEFMKLSEEYKTLVIKFNEYQKASEWAKSTTEAARDAVNIYTKEGLKRDDEQYANIARAIYNLATAGSTERSGRGSLDDIVENPETSGYFLRDNLFPALETRDIYIVQKMVDDPDVRRRLIEVATLIENDRIDRTPRQNIEELAKFIDSIGADVEPELEKAKQALEAFKTEHGAQPPEGSETNEQAA